jgi:predicted phosphodiesterase
MTRIAVLADIHGNLPALEAVIEALERLQPDLVLLNGDLINCVPFSAQVIDRVRSQDWAVVRGNHEFYYLNFGTERAPSDSQDPLRWGQLHWLVEQISSTQGRYLALLPDERTLYLPGLQPIGMAHGVPGNNRVGFYNELPDAQVAEKLHQVTPRTFISAHTHVQVDRHIYRQMAEALTPTSNLTSIHEKARLRHWHLINPGSIGLPLNGNPQAQFALLEAVSEEKQPGGWQVTFQHVPYDRRPALAAYHESGMAVAGGVMATLFYWQLVSARPEVNYFFRWAKSNGLNPDQAINDAFYAYVFATGRDRFIRDHDPLYQTNLTIKEKYNDSFVN